MPAAYKTLPQYTYADYLHWEGNWEIIDGIPHAMSPAPGMRHHHISGKLYLALSNALAASPCNCTAFYPLIIRLRKTPLCSQMCW
jgi:hypothetical protein